MLCSMLCVMLTAIARPPDHYPNVTQTLIVKTNCPNVAHPNCRPTGAGNVRAFPRCHLDEGNTASSAGRTAMTTSLAYRTARDWTYSTTVSKLQFQNYSFDTAVSKRFHRRFSKQSFKLRATHSPIARVLRGLHLAPPNPPSPEEPDRIARFSLGGSVCYYSHLDLRLRI